MTLIIDSTQLHKVINYLKINEIDASGITFSNNYDSTNNSGKDFIVFANKVYKFWLVKIFYYLGFNLNDLALIITITSKSDFIKAFDFIERDNNLIISRYFHMIVAKFFASSIKNTFIKPNHITLLNLLLCPCLFSCLIISSYRADIIAALLIQIMLIFDLSDGYLSRLQGTSSEYGKILDTVVDEIFTLTLSIGLIFNVLYKYDYISAIITALFVITFFANSLFNWINLAFNTNSENHLIEWNFTNFRTFSIKQKLFFIFTYSIRGLDMKFVLISIGLLFNNIFPIMVYFFVGNLSLFLLNIIKSNKRFRLS